MDIFKLVPHTIGSYLITKDNFEFRTKKQAPYYNKTLIDDGIMRHFAVCPACDNPIQIIGLRDGDKPFGKHFRRTVPHIANYLQENYDDCLLRARNVKRLQKSDKRATFNQLSKNILTLLVAQFDRVIYLLERNIGIKISERLAIDMLNNYIAGEGYLYRFASLHNIPWMFAYFSNSQTLVGRIIFKNEALKTAILTFTPFTFDSKYKSQVVNETKKYAALTFYFTQHKVKNKDESFNESLNFVVVCNKKEIYTQEIVFDVPYFNKLIQLEGYDDKRNHNLIQLARDACQDLL